MQSLFAHEERERKLDRFGDSLAALDATVDFQAVADRVALLLPSVDYFKGGRPPFPVLLTILSITHKFCCAGQSGADKNPTGCDTLCRDYYAQ